MSMKIERSSLEQVKERFNKNKRKNEEKPKEYDLDQRLKEVQEAEEKLKEMRREKKKRKHEEASGSQDNNVDDDFMKMMGFSGFGGSKKNN
jgi:U4/U6.U5 tri-snRNP component SNU23